jgi:glutathione S-transferase
VKRRLVSTAAVELARRVTTDHPNFAAAIRRLDKMVADMEQALADHEGRWLVGQTYSLADVGYAPYITRLDHLKFLDGMIEKRHRVAAWYDLMRTRTSYQEALAKWFNPRYLPLMEEKGSEAWPRVRELLAA